MDYRGQMRQVTPRFSLRRAMAAGGVLLLVALALLSCGSVDWFVVKRSLRWKFPDERWISTKELARWLADPRQVAPVLLDVRSVAEWNVSHLPGARRVDPAAAAGTAVGQIPKDAPIVTYCAIGYRSAALAQRLGRAGYTRVWNLEGSIFAWANEHRPLVRDGRPAKQVHPYSAFWGRLLESDVRAPLTGE